MNQIKEKLKQLRDFLYSCSEKHLADQIGNVLDGSDEDLKAFITSNELWGGSGSIADQTLIESETRREVEAILAELGEIQIAIGLVNVRTEMWVSVFRKWQK